MWCKFGQGTLQMLRQRTPRSPPCGSVVQGKKHVLGVSQHFKGLTNCEWGVFRLMHSLGGGALRVVD